MGGVVFALGVFVDVTCMSSFCFVFLFVVCVCVLSL